MSGKNHQPVRPRDSNAMDIDSSHTRSGGADDDMELCRLSAEDEPDQLFRRSCCWACLGPLGEEGQEDEDPMLVEQEAVTPALARYPGMPTKEEREAHMFYPSAV